MKIVVIKSSLVFVAFVAVAGALAGCMSETEAVALAQLEEAEAPGEEAEAPVTKTAPLAEAEIAVAAAGPAGALLGCEASPVVAAHVAAQGAMCGTNPEGSSYLDCDGDATNGCEVDPFSDPENCGGCGLACPGGFAACIQKRCCDVNTRECL